MASKKYIFVKGFTLIELLVVIGIIGILAGGIGLAMRDGNPAAAVRSAQGLLSGALSAARGQAALSQANARLIVQADRNNEAFLRSIRIVVADSSVAGGWRQVGDEILLPKSVCIVPPTTLAGATLVDTGGVWQAGHKSSLFNAATGQVSGIQDGTTLLISKDFSSLGTVEGGNIIVGPVKPVGADSVSFDNVAAVRGLVVSRYGVATLVNDAASFNP